MAEQRGGLGCLAIAVMAFAAILVAMVVLRRSSESALPKGPDLPGNPPMPLESSPPPDPAAALGQDEPSAGYHPVWIQPKSIFAEASLDALLDRPVYGRGPVPLVFAKLDASEAEPKTAAAYTARDYLDLIHRGYKLPLSDSVAEKKLAYRHISEPVRFLRRASASSHTAVSRLTLSGLDLGAYPGRMVGAARGRWIEHEPELQTVEASESHLVAESPLAKTTVRLIARADFNADGTEEMLLTVERWPRPSGPPHLKAVLIGRDRTEAPLRWIEPPPLADNRNLLPVRIAKSGEGQWALFLRQAQGAKLIAPLVPSVRVLQMSVSPTGRYAMVWSLLRRKPILKIVEVFDLKSAEPVEQFELNPPSTSETLRWVHGDRLLRMVERTDQRVYTLYDQAGRRLYEEPVDVESAVSPGGRYVVYHNRRRPPGHAKLTVMDLKTIEPAFVSKQSWLTRRLHWKPERLEIEYTSRDGNLRRHVLPLEQEH
ncbi:MAG: hypothetical protein R3236_06735 [Phycisphaeraceae bacterium]|nr:hypothetical protein [Phycisphaeraceae bacterium]